MPSKKYPVASDKVSAQEPMVKEAKAQPYRHGKHDRNATQAALSIVGCCHVFAYDTHFIEASRQFGFTLVKE
jgi:hypothetical protein